MNLQNFVTETLVQIVQGVADAQKQIGDLAIISPVISSTTAGASAQGYIDTRKGYAQSVQFDVAVTVADGKESKAGGGIEVLNISLGAAGSRNSNNSSVSRVQFIVPVVLPGGNQDTPGKTDIGGTLLKKR
ncbi:hypothetical protein [Vreelandella alkaliphila]|uniref:hypothetical protein n=1 Tax=Vreelandella alkaliphila TaxID=272774 RepID=UPI003FD8A33B